MLFVKRRIDIMKNDASLDDFILLNFASFLEYRRLFNWMPLGAMENGGCDFPNAGVSVSSRPPQAFSVPTLSCNYCGNCSLPLLASRGRRSPRTPLARVSPTEPLSFPFTLSDSCHCHTAFTMCYMTDFTISCGGQISRG